MTEATITDEVMASLAALSGQEYVDEYASVVKQRISAENRARKSAATRAAVEETRAKVGDARATVGRASDQVRERTADAAASPRQRRAILAELAPVIVRDQPATLLYPGTAVYIVPSWVDGLASPYRADPLRYLDRLSVRSEPAAGR